MCPLAFAYDDITNNAVIDLVERDIERAYLVIGGTKYLLNMTVTCHLLG